MALKVQPINEAELEVFRQTIPEDARQERFEYLRLRIDIIRAKFLIQRDQLETQHISVTRWAQALGMAGEYNKGSLNSLTGVMDERAIAEHIDISQPLIICLYKPKPKLPEQSILADGNHRLRKAFLNKVERLPVYVMPPMYQKLYIWL